MSDILRKLFPNGIPPDAFDIARRALEWESGDKSSPGLCACGESIPPHEGAGRPRKECMSCAPPKEANPAPEEKRTRRASNGKPKGRTRPKGEARAQALAFLQKGPTTIQELAAHLGCKDMAATWHLQKLGAVEVGTKERARLFALRPPPPQPLRMEEVIKATLQTKRLHEEVERLLRTGPCTTQELMAELKVGESTVRWTAERLGAQMDRTGRWALKKEETA